METTGSKSTDGDRSYKHTNTQWRESVSDILSCDYVHASIGQKQGRGLYVGSCVTTITDR